ncbi:protein mono-ADP-ribosyltransferase PARP4 isoform X2 [Parambassis ranga]|uniref:Poly [ADP-ribose] polymerase n=1 Tax=Parambassis ranga TaxID=210632 RepID=A0A6P7HBF0_9TELE|nr:protein mono-ADP-ribosyltransferase PARP4 isoform X2 [Parambassis ranga]
MGVFENCSVLLELKSLSVKEKKKLKSAVTEHGGSVSFVVNKQCSLVVTSDVANLSSSRLRNIQKYQTPVVGVDYVYSCVERGTLLPVDAYKLETSAASSGPEPITCQVPTSRAVNDLSRDQSLPVDSVRLTQRDRTPQRCGGLPKAFRSYTEADPDLPSFPDDFEVAKYSIYEKKNDVCCVLELHSSKGEEGRRYRVVRYWKDGKKAAVRDKLVFLPTSEEALQVYQTLRESLEASGLQKMSSVPPQAQGLGSAPLQQLLLEEKLNTGSVSQEVGLFVELLWTEALGCISSILTVPVNKLSLNDVSRAEGLLLQAQKKLKEENLSEVMSLLEEVYTLLPHREPVILPTAKLVSQKLDLCQLIRDVLNMSEVTLRSPVPSCLGKYRALRCSIEMVPPSSAEFQAVANQLQSSKVQIQRVVRVSRGVELQTFKSQLGNIQTLLHSSSPTNFVGILSRGLLLPRVGVEDHGVKRTDVGNLGSGIYFSDAVSTSLKYSKPSVTDGSRLLLVCDVALGQCQDVHRRDVTLTQAPEGHDSVHGVSRASKPCSEFEDDEFVVYSPDQVRLKYVVQFSLEGDHLKHFSPDINMLDEPCLPSSGQELSLEDDGTENIKNPLEDVTAGLLDSSGQQLPLQAVHVKCKLMDLLSQVIIFQKYTNLSSVPIEAKYVFPLDDSAAVCGFEAFINGKHVVGQVKEKEKARREYKQAIEKGHGAYLMDQDAPDVFTISVGNLPPGATVLIKVTFVSELIVRDGRILFSLPGTVAPWQESEALNQTTQVTVKKVCVTDEAAAMREFTLDLSLEMPFEISSLECITHKVKIKRTDCKAVVSVLPGEVMGPEGFQLSVSLSEVHLPRMWVEKHPDKDSQACMLVFYPDFDASCSSAADEVVLLLDTSESMKGEALVSAQRIALQVLRKLDRSLRLNVILFGTDHTDAFLTAKPLADVHQAAESFIKCSPAVGGSTELWRPLRALSLLPPSSGVRNLLLLSDGHIQNAELTLQLVRDNAQHSRLFTCGFSSTANRHMLRALAQAGGGAYEFFDTKAKHSWAERVACQVKRLASPGCSSVSVKWQQFSPAAPPPVQAPQQLHALFNDCHTLVYGFVPHCTQATLLGNLSGQELNTMVSTSELQKTKGTFLHKLTARALIRDYEDGNLDHSEAEHEGKKAELKNFIIELSKEFSILSQFTSFVAIEERDSDQAEDGFTDIPKLLADEDVDFLPYISWASSHEHQDEELFEAEEVCSDDVEAECMEIYGYEGPVAYLMSPDSESDFGHFSFDNFVQRKVCSIFAPSPPPPAAAAKFQGPQILASDVLPPPPPPPSSSGHPSISFCPPSLPPICFRGVPAPPPPPPAPHAAAAKFQSPQILASNVLLSSPPSSFGQPRMSSCPPPPPPRGVCGVPPPPVPLRDPPLPLDLRAPRYDVMFECVQMSRTIRPTPPPNSSGHPSISSCPPPLPPPGVCGVPPPPAPLRDPPLSLDLHAPRADMLQCALMSGEIRPTPPPSSSVHPSISFSLPPQAHHPPPPDIEPSEEPRKRKSCYRRKPIQRVSDRLGNVATGEIHAQSPETNYDGYLGAEGTPLLSINEEARTERLRMRGQAPQLFGQRAEGKAASSAAMFGGFSAGVFGAFQTARPADPKLKWTKIFRMQLPEGCWELTADLGECLNVNVELFANVFLKNKGIHSLGVKAHADILRMVATLLVLQLMRVEKLDEGKLLRTLFCLESSEPRPERWDEVKKAVDWVCWADRQYPCIYSRLEFGLSWESSTRQLLGFDSLPPFSPLSGLDLRRTAVPLLVH